MYVFKSMYVEYVFKRDGRCFDRLWWLLHGVPQLSCDVSCILNDRNSKKKMVGYDKGKSR